MSPVPAVFILRSYLNDDVKEEVDNLDDNLETLWQRLDKKYGNCGKLVDAILSDLSTIPKGDGKQTLEMIKTVIERTAICLEWDVVTRCKMVR